jgi:hypothetical protein
MEILDRKNLPDGSVILMGTVSHLHKVGVGQYAREWTQVNDRMGRRWPNARFGPLVPIIKESVPGSVSRELVELTCWYSRVYGTGTLGLPDAWSKMITSVIENSMGGTVLTSPEQYTISLPISLDPSAPSAPVTFKSEISRPSILNGMDQGQSREILCTIGSVLSRDFKVEISTGVTSASAMKGDGAKEQIRNLVVIGASNLKRSIPHLNALGYGTMDLCTPGWMATPDNVTNLVNQLQLAKFGPEVGIILDLFGNSCTRFIDYDGSVTKPLKIAGTGGYHLPGEVTVIGEDIFSKLIGVVKPILDEVPDLVKIVIPPSPGTLTANAAKTRLIAQMLGKRATRKRL